MSEWKKKKKKKQKEEEEEEKSRRTRRRRRRRRRSGRREGQSRDVGWLENKKAKTKNQSGDVGSCGD